MSVCFSSKNFPKGSLIYILDYLPIDDLAVSGRVSKIFLEASRNDKLCNKFYPLLKAEIQGYLRNNEEFPDRWPTQREICILAAKDVSSLFGPFLRNLGGMEWYLSLPRCQMNDQGRSGSSHIDYLTPRDLVDSTGKAHAVMRGFDHRRGLPAIGVVFEDGKKQHVQAFYPLRGQVFSCSNQQNRVRGVDASPGIDSHKLHAFSLQMKKMMEGRHLTTIIKQSPDVAQKHAQFLRETTRGAFSTALYLASPAFARNVRNHVLEYVGEFSGQEQKGYLNEALSVSDCPETLVDAVGIAHLLSFPLKAAKFGEEAGAIAVPAVGRIAHEGIDYSDQVFESAYGGIQDNLELDPRKTSDGITRIQGRYSEEGLLIKFQHKQTGRENVRFFYEQPRDYAENLFRCIGVEPEDVETIEEVKKLSQLSSEEIAGEIRLMMLGIHPTLRIAPNQTTDEQVRSERARVAEIDLKRHHEFQRNVAKAHFTNDVLNELRSVLWQIGGWRQEHAADEDGQQPELDDQLAALDDMPQQQQAAVPPEEALD